MRKSKLRKGAPAKFTPFSGEILGELLIVGAAGDYADLDAALVHAKAATWESTTAMSGTASTTQGSELVVGVGTSFTTETESNGFIIIDGNIQAVRDVQDDTHCRLWHGAMTTVSASAITSKKLTYFTIKILEDSAATSMHIFSDGVGLKLVAELEKFTYDFNYSIQLATYNYYEKTHCRARINTGVSSMVNNVAAGVGGASRSIFNFHDYQSINRGTGGETTLALYGASITFDNVHGNNVHCLFQSDYLYVNNHARQSSFTDVILYDTKNVYDIAYAHELVGVDAFKTGAIDTGAGSMYETNVSVAGKVVNLRNANITHVPTTDAPNPTNFEFIPIYSASVGSATLNIIDSIIHVEDFPASIKDWYEVLNRGATINIDNSFRADGSAIRIYTP